MRKSFYIMLAVLLLFGFAGCDKEEKEEPYQLSMFNFFSEYLNVICNSAASCKAGFVTNENKLNCPDVIMHHPYPFPAFKRGEKVVFMQKFEMLVGAEKVGWVKVDMKKAEICFDIIRKMSPCDPMEVHLFDIVECVDVFEGTKSLRQSCNQDEECFYGWCDTRGGRCPGTCVDYKEPGQNCNASLDRCAPGYTCRSSGCSKSTIGQPGDPCLSDVDCSSFLYCRRRSENDATGNCFKRQNDGEVCLNVNECMTGLECINNLCSKARVSDVAGAPCGKSEDRDGNEITLSCNIFGKLECGPQKTCQKFPQQGMPCSSTCDKSLFCHKESGLCQYQAMVGRPCDDHNQCTSFYCYNGVCGVPECIDVQ